MKPLQSPARWQGAAWIIGGSILFSSKAILVKLAYLAGAAPTPLLALRMAFSFPVFAAIAWFSRNQSPGIPPSRREWGGVALTGLLGYYLASLFDFWGLAYISASLERLILFTYPTMVLLISRLMFGMPITRSQGMALLLTYAGIWLVLGGEEPAAGSQWLLGAGWVLLSAVCYAFYLVGSGRLIPRFGPERYTALAMMSASAAVFLHSGLQDGIALFQQALPVYAYSVLMALLATVLPSVMIARGIRLIGAGPAAIIASVGPVSTIFQAWFFLGERINAQQLLGSLVVLGGVTLISLPQKPGR
jgi:drug/metabolite transporter (DMT)-like permease